MRIKKFTGDTLKEATETMKQELGPEAIVIHTRTRKQTGAFGLFGKRVVEITGAIDEISEGQPERGLTADAVPAATYSLQAISGRKPPQRSRPTQYNWGTDEQHDVDELFTDKSHPKNGRGQSGKSLSSEHQVQDVTVLHQVRDEVERVRGLLQTLQNEVKQITKPALPKTMQDIYTQLCEQEVEVPLVNNLINAVSEKLQPNNITHCEIIEETLLNQLQEIISTEQSPAVETKLPRVIALVGPTGIGKTTTIAKLASTSKLLAHKKVGLISADTYRIGALDQLRIFSAIARIPLEVAYEPVDIPAALAKFRDCDIVYLDTVGRSQRNGQELTELKKFLDVARPDEIHLVLSPATGLSTLEEIVDGFQVLHPNRLLFTKIDEAKTQGSILNVIHRTRLPVSYLTNGQTVPDDLIVAEPSQVASLVYHGALVHA